MQKIDLTAYLVIGPENCTNDFGETIRAAVRAGFTVVQVRSKVLDALPLMEATRVAREAIDKVNPAVKLLVNDRLDVVLACLERGIMVDGIHVGQTDIPVSVCRKYLGKDKIVGLSARTSELLDYVRTADLDGVDYLGAGPLHFTPTKADCGVDATGNVVTRSLSELRELHKISPLPVVVGGGVKATDLANLKATGVEGFFVVSAVTAAVDSYAAARELVEGWEGGN